MNRIKTALYFFLYSIGPLQVLAADNAPPHLPGSAAPDLFSASVRMFSYLAFLIGLLLLFLYILRRAAAHRTGLLGGREYIRLISTKALAPKKYLVLVDVADSVLTLGVTNENITCLHKMDSESFYNTVQAQTETRDKSGTESGFYRRLKALASRPAAPAEEKKP